MPSVPTPTRGPSPVTIPTSSHFLEKVSSSVEIIQPYQYSSRYVDTTREPLMVSDADYLTAVGFIEMGSRIVLTHDMVKTVNFYEIL